MGVSPVVRTVASPVVRTHVSTPVVSHVATPAVYSGVYSGIHSGVYGHYYGKREAEAEAEADPLVYTTGVHAPVVASTYSHGVVAAPAVSSVVSRVVRTV